jgi:hypothetical protein
MGFMNAEMTDRQVWMEIDGPQGTEWIPADLFGIGGDSCKHHLIPSILALTFKEDSDGYRTLPDEITTYSENKKAFRAVDSIRFISGYGVRSSASGYMDRTEWAVYTNKRDAERAARKEQRECDGLED